MQFMLLMIPKGYETAKPGTVPDAERVAQMMKFNQALKDAGVLVTLNGLHPVSAGARVSFAGGRPTVVDGPFVETKEMLGGYWVIRVKSKDEAIEWAKRCPATENETIEIRQVQEMEDFPADVQKAAEGFTALQHAGRSVRRRLRATRAEEPRSRTIGASRRTRATSGASTARSRSSSASPTT